MHGTIRLVAGCVLLPALAVAGGNASLELGRKNLKESDWAPMDGQGLFALHVDWKPASLPFSLCVDLRGSAAEDEVMDIEMTATTSELGFGFRAYAPLSSAVELHAGAGLALVRAELEGRANGVTVTDDDSSMGLWAAGGVCFPLGRLVLGGDARFTLANVTLYDTDLSAGGLSYGVSVGFRW